MHLEGSHVILEVLDDSKGSLLTIVFHTVDFIDELVQLHVAGTIRIEDVEYIVQLPMFTSIVLRTRAKP